MMSDTINKDEKYLKFDQLCQDYMTELYQGISGFISYQPGEKEKHAEDKVFLTYGEILFAGVNQIIDYIDITEEDVFCDFGSGIGKVPLQFFLKTPVIKSLGIEFSEARHQFAEKVYESFRKEFQEIFAGRELKSIQGNFLEIDISDVTIIYTCSTCFDETLLQKMAEHFDKHPKLKYVISMKALPLKELQLDTILEVECTWDKTKCHVYSRNKLAGYK